MNTMQQYIEQIIGDLQKAKRNLPPDPKLGTEKTYKEFEEKMFALETAPDIPAKQLYGVSYEELPPAEKLTNEQMQQLIDAIAELFEARNYGVDTPENVPINLLYEVMRDEFKGDIHYMPGFSSDFDFCINWCPDCKILDYCEYREEFWTDKELEEEKIRVAELEKNPPPPITETYVPTKSDFSDDEDLPF